MTSQSLTIVVPLFNEQHSLEELQSLVSEVCRKHGLVAELLLIDDGSTDESWRVIAHLSKTHHWVRGVRLRRNFGKAAALAAGFERSTGEFVVTMDADLQDDPREIPRLLDGLKEGLDVVSGWKRTRHDPWHKTIPSRVFNWLISHLTGVKLHDHNCGLKAYRRCVLSEIQLYGEMHRFLPVLAAARGFRVGEIAVEHHARKHGRSKYGVERLVKGFLDTLTVYFLTGFGNRPQHLLGSVGLASFSAGAFGLFALSLWWVISRLSDAVADVHLHQKAIFYFCILAVLLGIQLVSIGFLAELLTAIVRPTRRPYSVADDTRGLDSQGTRSGRPVGSMADKGDEI